MMKRIFSFLLIFSVFFIPFRFSASAEELYGKVYCRNTKQAGKIALTFDDGPHPRYTQEILKILEEYHVTATFFIIGVNAVNYPSDLQKIVDCGCELGNHTDTHCRIRNLTEEEVRLEIKQCEDTVYQLCGVRPCVFRPPEGLMNEYLKAIAKDMGYNVVLWSIDTKDWALTPPKEILKIVKSQIRGGDIVLMHDYVSGGNTTCNALRLIIPELLRCGYEFVTVSELIQGDHE
ncbi:MAG: polysaccharide deacetylase family protein [Clostridia bacterium]|nr:polysaccharide deacetylase family protein [Clostridia bacterium]